MVLHTWGQSVSLYARRAGGCVATFALLLLSACAADDKTSLGYMFVNHTNHGVVYLTIDGEGGILVAGPRAQSGDACCVSVPKKWRPDLRVTVGWQEEGEWELDGQGQPTIRDGKKVLIEGKGIRQTVSIPEYKESEIGAFVVHVMPDNQAKVVVSQHGAGHPTHPIPNVIQDGFKQRRLEIDGNAAVRREPDGTLTSWLAVDWSGCDAVV